MISFIGLRTQEVEIKPVVNVALKLDTETLDEVIVVAYGTAKKASFTGSASVMKAGELSAPKQSLVNPNRSLGFLCVVRQREIL